jgi:hypothetical protein
MPAALRLALRLATALIVALVGLTGCGSDESAKNLEPKKGADGTTIIDVTVEGDTVDPAGATVKVEAGKPVTLHITADAAGEIHVHSSPEQEIEYEAGTSDKTITIKQPGVVDVESHTLDKLIVQLEVR